ncbi:N-acetylmuramoyl-L-alanine amidase [Pseudooctadecabacter jejudonensis]|uniref:N-acetylmuramoyl-L-alanine amidase n=1 Tax=Pseudooctadecabacter jejudonensis TaxID=1391910 RepID=A0A1Y5RQC2_9RHOB|nr:N-acetylmuramoyl-L-alanine amidase [Pseudooctadecabacter jejudonensis]SLN22918.1 N-acetylmuramoyl-L-alanine amidase AmiD precursor [Pseudooctadecabacter jejudonensis]
MGLSPNFGPRRDGATPDLIVLHYTAMPDWTRARDWLCAPEAEVSAHYIISPQGDVVSLVDEDMRAWHAGAGRWGDVTDVNSRSIGIELSNDGASPFAAPLMDALEGLMRGIMGRWTIPPHRVIAHSDLAPGRKIDPGPRFDWARLARQDLAITAAPTAPCAATEAAFRRDAAAFGYTADVAFEVLLDAFRLRHRAGYLGPLDGTDCALAADLAARFGLAQMSATS